MQKLTAIFLIFALLSVGFSKCFIYVGFIINKNYIAASLCENRNKPQLHCKGKCFLMKKIKQAEEKEKTDEQQFKKSNLYEALVNTRILLSEPLAKNIKIVFNNPTFNYPTKSNSVFEPPQA
jgi:hypothetical protein